jgi:YidC/Oxa1 family membrane protein insertase
MPVFLVLYQVLSGLTRRVSDLGASVGWVSSQVGFGQTPTKTPTYERVFDPAWINPTTKMYQDLSTSYQMEAFGLDLSESASKAMQQGIGHALPFLVLIVIVAATGFIQQRQIQGRNTGTQINSQQQMIMKIMPFFLPIFSFGFPAGLALYWCTQNFCRIGTNAYITRSVYGSDDDGGSTDRPAKQAGKQVGKGSDEGGSASSSDSKASKSKSGSRNGTAPESAKPKPKSPSSSKRVQGGGSRPAGRKSGSGSGRRSGEPRKSGE